MPCNSEHGSNGNLKSNRCASANTYASHSAIGELEHDASEGIDLITWDINGKIHSIQRTPGWSIPGSSPTAYPSDLEFKYDAMGNRICKIEKPRDYAGILNEDTWVYTYYVRDASGNVMAVYTRDLYQAGSNYTDEMRIKETHVYGGSRLGIRDYTAQAGITASVTYAFSGYVSSGDDDNGKFNTGAQVTNTAMPHPSSTAQTRTRGRKVYELTNHLGNVLVTFYDRKISKDDISAGGEADYYVADVASASDYSAFGAPLPGRSFGNANYRYGFNGKEDDRETVGTGHGTQDYGARMYNASLGRFMSIDPLMEYYPELTPYQFASNTPIQAIDLDGLERQFAQGCSSLVPKPVTASSANPAPQPANVVKPVTMPKGDQMSAINQHCNQQVKMTAAQPQPVYHTNTGEAKQGGIMGTPEYQMQATNLDNVCTYALPFYNVGKKLISGQEVTSGEYAIETAFAILPFLELEKPLGVVLGKFIQEGVLITSELIGYKTIGMCTEFAGDFMFKIAPGLVENGATVTRMEINMTGGKSGVMSVIDNGVEKQISTNGVHQYVEVTNKCGESVIYDNVFSDGISKEKYLEYLGGDAGNGYLNGEQIIQQYANPVPQ